MSTHSSRQDAPFTEEFLLNAYCHGYFPMGCGDSGEIRWYRPDPRAVIPLDGFHISKSLSRLIRKKTHEVRINTCFEKVMRYCMKLHGDTWITEKMVPIYTRLHQLGYAHSLEIYMNDTLAGGLYGVSIAGAFFGESMFHLQNNASKIALCELVLRMRGKGMALLDTQFINPHIAQFYVETIPDHEYMTLLHQALSLPVSFV
ncbi:MAG: leucyl/phenylalanyl-tRNA--protein transferase [Candidatus Aureabacteria bacterium]|nr:leucyl/phenylalanyl-tRNA--protein transferase [Candidatus Auribacterota bacterium]